VIDHSEPLARLRAANPVPTPDPAAVTTPAAVALLQRIVTEEPGAPVVGAGRWPRRRRLRLLVPALVLTGAAGAVGYALVNNGVSSPQTVACYQTADLHARTQVVAGDARGPATACADLWTSGAFGPPSVPPLVVCALPSGMAGVFPDADGTDVCARLGLAPVPAPAPSPTPAPEPVPGSAPSSPSLPGPPPTSTPAPADENARFLAFRDAVLPQFLDAACVDPATARAVVRRELDRAGLADWAVRTGQGVGDGFSADRPCATLAFRPTERAVLLVPAPPRR
jgi:hypothetical protein